MYMWNLHRICNYFSHPATLTINKTEWNLENREHLQVLRTIFGFHNFGRNKVCKNHTDKQNTWNKMNAHSTVWIRQTKKRILANFLFTTSCFFIVLLTRIPATQNAGTSTSHQYDTKKRLWNKTTYCSWNTRTIDNTFWDNWNLPIKALTILIKLHVESPCINLCDPF